MIALTWTWRCLADGRTDCPAGDDGTRGMNKHMDETKHGVMQIGRPS